MSDSCFKINDLSIPGTRQEERPQKGLAADFVRPDERTMAALLVFVSQYAGLIRFYRYYGPQQVEYVPEGDWKALWMSSEGFQYAGVAITPASLPNITFYRWLNLYEKGSTRQVRFAAWRVLWDILFSIYRDINEIYKALPVGMELRSFIGQEISNQLTADFMNAAARYLNAHEADMIPEIAAKNIPPVPGEYVLYQSTSPADDVYPFGYADDLLAKGFDLVWMHPSKNHTSWTAFYEELETFDQETDYAADPSGAFVPDFFGGTGLTGFDRIDYSTLNIRKLFERAFGSYARIIGQADQLMKQKLESQHDHQPHQGLMLSFLRLFELLQGSINQFTHKHLSYYYERVLQLNPNAPVPDSVHLWMQPAKNIDNHLLRKNTLALGGKDGDGQVLFYALNQELVVNRSAIAALKTLYLQPGATAGVIENVYASPYPLQEDGDQAKDMAPSWDAFGDQRLLANSGAETKAQAMGFAIAAPILHLTTGVRKVILKIKTDASGKSKIQSRWTEVWLRNVLTVQWSGLEGWSTLLLDGANFDYVLPNAANIFEWQFTLPVSFAPVTGYDPEVCDGGLPGSFPVIRILINQTDPQVYDAFEGIAISELNIDVEVDNMDALTIQGPQGKLDPAKPFQPFGPSPVDSDIFYVGHPELVHQPITFLRLSMSWQDYNSNLKAYYDYNKAGTTTNYLGISSNNSFLVDMDILRNKQWSTLKSNDYLLSYATTTFVKDPAVVTPPISLPEVYNTDPIAYDLKTQNGFLRLELKYPNAAFGHKIWPKLLSEQTVAFAANQTINSLPNPPYVPVAIQVQLDYRASMAVPLVPYASKQPAFFGITPFGYQTFDIQLDLFPRFEGEIKNADSTFEKLAMESVWYIGVKDCQPGELLNLLIQLNEGSEDISVDTPEVHWNYLSTDGWKHFDTAFLGDDTNGLLQSGIVMVMVPEETDFLSKELPAGHCWIAAMVQDNSAGLPQVIQVHTNAVKATLFNAAVHPGHFLEALPPGQVSKFFIPDPAIKKVNQPYPGFGGKPAEDQGAFYTRVSERLRHKDRAVTIWDYERLVLHQFPEVYLVKCLNHTGYSINCDDTTAARKYREKLPGQVMLIPLPFASKVQLQNICQPVFSQGFLQRVHDFIAGSVNPDVCTPFVKPRNCGLATLHVENPVYETISVECHVRIRPCIDPYFYAAQLKEDLNKFLAPWIEGDFSAIRFGGRLHVSVVVYFMEQLHYVDHVGQVKIIQQDAESAMMLNASEPDLAVATTSRSVLTSSDNHTIHLLNL